MLGAEQRGERTSLAEWCFLCAWENCRGKPGAGSARALRRRRPQPPVCALHVRLRTHEIWVHIFVDLFGCSMKIKWRQSKNSFTSNVFCMQTEIERVFKRTAAYMAYNRAPFSMKICNAQLNHPLPFLQGHRCKFTSRSACQHSFDTLPNRQTLKQISILL